MHSTDLRAYTFYDKAIDAMSRCAHYAGEMDLGDVDQHAFQAAFTLEDQQNLKSLIGDRHYKKYWRMVQKAFQIDLDRISHFKPIFIHGMLSESRLHKDRQISLDFQLYQDALAMGLTTSGMETQQEQMDIASKISLKAQLLMLKSSLRNIHRFKSQVESIANMYAKGDSLGIYRKSSKKLYGMKSIMLTERNVRMADRIDDLCREQSSFISIGAGHLSGSMGVLRLLKKKEYIIVELS